MSNQELLELLKQLEYSGTFSSAGRICPSCDQAFSKYNHKEDCKLDKAIKYLEFGPEYFVEKD